MAQFRYIFSIQIYNVIVINVVTYLQLGCKYIFLRKMRPLLDILRFTGLIYEKNSNPKNKNYALCMRYAKMASVILKSTILCYIVIGFSVAAPNTIGYFMSGQLKPAMSQYIVGVKEYSQAILVLLHTQNYLMVPMVTFCIVTTDTLTFITFANISLISQELIAELNRFDNDLDIEVFGSNKIGMEPAIKRRLLEIIQMNQTYVE